MEGGEEAEETLEEGTFTQEAVEVAAAEAVEDSEAAEGACNLTTTGAETGMDTMIWRLTRGIWAMVTVTLTGSHMEEAGHHPGAVAAGDPEDGPFKC